MLANRCFLARRADVPPMFENVFVPHDAYDGFISNARSSGGVTELK